MYVIDILDLFWKYQAADRTSITSEEIESEEKELAAVDLTKPPPSEDEQKEEDKTVERNVEEDDGKEKKVSISTYFKFFLVMVNSTLISMIKYLNQFSRDYRYIRKILAMEKKILKVYIQIYYFL